MSNKPTANESIEIYSIKPRYINIRENIYAELSNDAMAVYIALRFEGDYSKEIAKVTRNIQFLCNKAKIGRTRCKECLQELREAGLLKIIENEGYQSTYLVADELGFFIQKESPDTPPSRQTTPPSRTATTPSRQTTDIINNTFTNTSKDLIVDSANATEYSEDDLFMLFYSMYPNKQKPRVAHRAFRKLKPTADFVSMLCTDVQLRVENNWFGRHKSKIPHPATYLNTREWESELYRNETKVSSSVPTALTDEQLEGIW